MLGTFVNGLAIVAGSLLGLVLHRGIPERFKQTLLQGVALAVMLIGWKNALLVDELLVVILAIVIGGLLGEGLGIEARLENLGQWLEARMAARSGDTRSLARGFVTASLVYASARWPLSVPWRAA